MPAPVKVEVEGGSMNVPLRWTTCSQLLTKSIHPAAGATKVAVVGSTKWPNHPREPEYLQVHNAKFASEVFINNVRTTR